MGFYQYIFRKNYVVLADDAVCILMKWDKKTGVTSDVRNQ